VRIWRPELADLEAVAIPSVHPRQILIAAAQAYSVDPVDVVSSSRAPGAIAARQSFVRIGRLESYSDAQLAPFLRRTRQRITQIASRPIDDDAALRIARTLLRHVAFRARIDRWVTAFPADGSPLQIC
jgi:hypothetical protein